MFTTIPIVISYLLTPWRRILLEKLTDFQLVKKYPAFHGTRRFITAFTSASVWWFRTVIRFYGEQLTEPSPIPKLEDHTLSAVRDCLCSIFAATLHIAGRSSISNLRTRRDVPCRGDRDPLITVRTPANTHRVPRYYHPKFFSPENPFLKVECVLHMRASYVRGDALLLFTL
jgi:hypothetical protein